MAHSYELIVWDFDGVLNRNVIDGRFIWSENMNVDLDLDPKSFADFIFGTFRVALIMRGKLDLLDAVGDWLTQQDTKVTPKEFLEYWFTKDALPDPEVLSWLSATKGLQVIGTNNETHRASFIENEMGFGSRVEHIFSSGRLGAAKPDEAFFEAIEHWSGIAPENILLVDDLDKNISAAQARGWQGFHFTDETRDDLPLLFGLNT